MGSGSQKKMQSYRARRTNEESNSEQSRSCGMQEENRPYSEGREEGIRVNLRESSCPRIGPLFWPSWGWGAWEGAAHCGRDFERGTLPRVAN